MFLKILMGFLFLVIVAAETFAAGPATLPIEHFVTSVAKRTGSSADSIREIAIETLRENGNFSKEDLERISQHAEAGFEPAKANLMVHLLQQSAKFRITTGLEAIRIETIQNEAANAFEQLSDQEAVRRLRRASTSLDAALLKSQVTKNLIEVYSSKIAFGKDVADARVQLARVKGDLRTTMNELYFATTQFLILRGIPYQGLISDGAAALKIDVPAASSAFRREIKTETLNAIAPDQIIRRPAVMIDIANMNEESVYDSARATLFLGISFLHRIK